jgi:hypothetical protein
MPGATGSVFGTRVMNMARAQVDHKPRHLSGVVGVEGVPKLMENLDASAQANDPEVDGIRRSGRHRHVGRVESS